MKLGELKSLGHNIADSFASGIGLLVGYCTNDVYGEAAATKPGYIDINFLDATATGSKASPQLLKAIEVYRNAVPDLCKKHQIEFELIRTLSARFGTDPALGAHFTVTVESRDGRRSVDRYFGWPGKRPRMRRA